jgi:hypothetical protein
MIVDLRIYTCRPQKTAAFFQIYRAHGWDVQCRILGRCIGWYTTMEGPLNQLVHLWAYRDMADRQARRERLYADPEWLAYIARSEEAGLLVSMENRLLKPTDFCPMPPGWDETPDAI